MKFKFLKERWQRVTLRVFVVLITLVLITGFFVNLYWSPILADKVKKAVLNSSDSLYHVNFTDADLHVFQEKIVLFNIDLEPDMAVYNQLKKINLAPNNLYHLHIKKLVLTYIHPLDLYFKKKLDIGEIILSAPELNISYQLNHTKDTVEKDTRNLYQRISKTLKSIHVGHIGLNDVKFKYEDYSGNKVVISELKEMNLNANDLLIDSASMIDKKRFLYCSDVVTELNNFTGRTLNGLYKYKMGQLKLSTRNAILHAQDITLQPISSEEFFKRSHHDRFTMHIDSLQLNDFDFLSYHKFRKFTAKSLILAKGTLAVYSNPNPNKQTLRTDRSPTFPNAGIFRLKTDLKIDTILLQHINIAYTELNVKSRKSGSAYFNNTTGRILNLTTNPAALQKNKICNVNLTSYFMNKGKLDVNFKFTLGDKNLVYSYNGHLGQMNLPGLNSTIMPLAMVKINSGKLKSFDFDIHGDVNSSHGKVSVLYNDLKVTILKPDTIQNKLKHMTIASLFANIFILKHNNPDNPGQVPRAFMVSYKRPLGSAFFKTVWKTLLIGIRQCAGFGEEKEKEVKTQLANRAAEKKEHKEKRAERKEKKREKELLKNSGSGQ